MLILIARHKKVFFEKMYLSNLEHDAVTSKYRFYPFCLVRVCLDNFLKTFSCMQDRAFLKKLQFLAVTYDMGILSCAFEVVFV